MLGQNVMVGPRVKVGSGRKIQNNVALYGDVELDDDVFCGLSCVFTNVNDPCAFREPQGGVPADADRTRRQHRGQRDGRVWA